FCDRNCAVRINGNRTAEQVAALFHVRQGKRTLTVDGEAEIIRAEIAVLSQSVAAAVPGTRQLRGICDGRLPAAAACQTENGCRSQAGKIELFFHRSSRLLFYSSISYSTTVFQKYERIPKEKTGDSCRICPIQVRNIRGKRRQRGSGRPGDGTNSCVS